MTVPPSDRPLGKGDDTVGANAATLAALRESQTLLAGQKEALQAAMDEAPLEQSLAPLIRTAIEIIGGSARCAFYMADDAGAALRHLVGMPDDYAAAVDGFVISPESLACGLACATQTAVIAPDISEVARWPDWRQLAKRFGYRACWSFPVETTTHRICGAFAFYFPQPRHPHAAELISIAALCQTAAIIIFRHQETQKRLVTEAALRARETDLMRVQRIGGVGGIDIDIAGGLNSHRSPEYLRLHGLAADTGEETHAQWLARVHPEDRIQAEQTLLTALNGDGDQYDSLYRIIRPSDGDVRWIHARADIERDSAHRPVRLVGAHVDITDQKRSQENLRREEERQAFLLQLSDVLGPLGDPEAVQGAAVKFLAEQFNVMRATYFEVDPDQDGFALTARYELQAPPLPNHMRLSDFSLDMSAAYRRGRALVVRDTEAEAQLESQRQAYRAIGVRAWAAVPLVKDSRLQAIVGVHSATPRDWTETEIGLLEELADRTWGAVERAQAQIALQGSERQLQVLVEGIPQLVWRAVNDGTWTWCSPQWIAFTGLSLEQNQGWGWADALHPDDRPAARAAWDQAISTGRLEFDARLRHGQTGDYRWFQTRAAPVRNDAGGPTEWLGASTDVDDLRKLKDRQQILVGELQHRVRNILTVIRSVFSRTVEAGGDLDHVADHFRGRLDALARTQVIVTRDAEGFVDLENLIRDELLSVGVSDGPKLTIQGPGVMLAPHIAESIGLAVHELTTNALKYGALRLPKAELKIHWQTNKCGGSPPRLSLVWEERGVPVVVSGPIRVGFGRELIEEALPYRLGAETRLEFRSGGVRCEISLSLPKASAANVEGVA